MVIAVRVAVATARTGVLSIAKVWLLLLLVYSQRPSSIAFPPHFLALLRLTSHIRLH